MIQAHIAGISVQLCGGDSAFFPNRFKQYETVFEKPDLSIRLERVSEIAVPDGKMIAERDGMVMARTETDTLCRYVIGKKTGRVLQRVDSSDDYAEYTYTLLESRRHPSLSLTDFEYLHSGEAFANRLAYMGGVVMHGSAIAYKSNGIVFSAPSGTGKSTHAGLWKQYYGECVQHVNDDKPAIRFDGNTPFVYGTPWSGKTDTNNNISAPLKAIVFLKQASENRIHTLSVSDALLHIHNETVRPFYDEALGLKVLQTAEQLVQSVPVFLLECTISREAVDLVKNSLNW